MKEEIVSEKEWEGVRPTSSTPLDPRQSRFINLYLDTESPSFGNCYRSALNAGYTSETARNLTHNRPKWLSEKVGQTQVMDPELLLLKLTTIINGPNETTQNKLKAIDMMMRYHQMFGNNQASVNIINIESVL